MSNLEDKNTMRVTVLTDIDEIDDVVPRWATLAEASPMLSPPWLLNWWRTQQTNRSSLFLVCVHDCDDTLIGIAPWYREHDWINGQSVRFLGSGEVCSDHMGLICASDDTQRVSQAIANWLMSPRARGTWDSLLLEAVDLNDASICRLTAQMQLHGALINSRPAIGSWFVNLPTDWDEYLQGLSKNHRKRCRRWERSFLDTGRVRRHRVQEVSQVPRGFHVLRDLHQRRRQQLGQSGAFADSRIVAFHQCAMPELLQAGQLELAWLEIDGRPAACEYQLLGHDTVFAYQSGFHPDFIGEGVGNLSVLVSIKMAIDAGMKTFDFMRGDEPYKAKWGARPRQAREISIRPANLFGATRHVATRAGEQTKRLMQEARGFLQTISALG